MSGVFQERRDRVVPSREVTVPTPPDVQPERELSDDDLEHVVGGLERVFIGALDRPSTAAAH